MICHVASAKPKRGATVGRSRGDSWAKFGAAVAVTVAAELSLLEPALSGIVGLITQRVIPDGVS